MSEKEKTIWVTCASCGEESRKHQILYERVIFVTDEPGTVPSFRWCFIDSLNAWAAEGPSTS